MSFLKDLFSLLPPVVIYNIIARSNEHGQKDVVDTIIGSEPYHPPEDSGQPWTKVSDEPLEYQRVIRKSKK